MITFDELPNSDEALNFLDATIGEEVKRALCRKYGMDCYARLLDEVIRNAIKKHNDQQT